MVFKTLRMYVFLIFSFIIISEEVFGGRLGELSEEARRLVSQAPMTGRRQFQSDLESFLLRVLQSTGYAIGDTEVYIDKTFIQRSIEDQQQRLAVLREERDALRALEPKDEGPPSVHSQALNLSFQTRMVENTLAHETVALHLRRLQMRYDLLWGSSSEPKAHTSDLLPANLERKSGWTSYYFVDPSSILFIVDPSDHAHAETIFDVLFLMFEHLNSYYQTGVHPFPAAVAPALRTRFAAYTPRNKDLTAHQWGRGFIEQERLAFAESQRPLEEELRKLRFSLEDPHAQGLNIASLYSRIERSDHRFKELFGGMATLHLEQLLETSLLIATAASTAVEKDAELEELKARVERMREEALALQHEVEGSAQRFTDDREFIEHMPITTIEGYFRELEDALQIFKERYDELSRTIQRIQTRLEEREEQAHKQLEADAEELTNALRDIPVLEGQVTAFDRRIKEAEQDHEAAVKELMDAQTEARISDVNLSTQRFYHHVENAMATSLEQIMAAFDTLSSSAIELLVGESSASLSEQEGRDLTMHLAAVETVIETMSTQMDTEVSKFNGLFEGELAAVQPLTLPETTPFETALSLRVSSMHMVNNAVRALFQQFHVIVAGHLSPATLPEGFLSSFSGRVSDASATEFKSVSPVRRLLEELDTLSTSRETIIFVETQTQLLRHQFEALFLNKSKMPSKGRELSPPASQTILVRA